MSGLEKSLGRAELARVTRIYSWTNDWIGEIH